MRFFLRIPIPTDRNQRDSNPRHSNVDIQICRNIDALNHCATAASGFRHCTDYGLLWTYKTNKIIVRNAGGKIHTQREGTEEVSSLPNESRSRLFQSFIKRRFSFTTFCACADFVNINISANALWQSPLKSYDFK